MLQHSGATYPITWALRVPSAYALLAALTILAVMVSAMLPLWQPKSAKVAAPYAAPRIASEGAGLPALAPSRSTDTKLIPADAMPAISAEMGRAEPSYQVALADGAALFTNAKHGLSAQIDSTGARVDVGGRSLGLGAATIGRGGSIVGLPPGALAASANRVELARGDVTEWYVNGPYGLQQGFTLAQAPAAGTEADQSLAIGLALSEGVSARVNEDRRGLTLVNADGAVVASYTGLLAFDAAGRALPARLEAGETSIWIRVVDVDATYPITVDPMVQVGAFTASDGAAVDNFGSAVAMSGDTIVVGAPHDDIDGKADQGSVYVFVRPTSGWSTTSSFAAKLTASDGAASDQFGTAVAFEGETIVVGAPNDDGVGADQGSSYVFVRPISGWATTSAYTAKLTASDGASGDFFGRAVAIDAATIVVGAMMADVDAKSAQGAAYVYFRPPSGWATTSAYTAKLTASDGAANDYCGSAVAVSGATVAVGASGDDSYRGSVYIFTRPAAGWATTSTYSAKLTASDGAIQNHFGSALSLDGDTLVVGAPYSKVDSNDNQGSAYVYARPVSGWSTTSAYTAKLTAADGSADDHFGYAVAIDSATIVVGAYNDDVGGNADQGSAYVFTRPAAGWTTTSDFTAKLTTDDGAAGDLLGCAVAVSDEIIVVGAYNDDVGGSIAKGSARLFTQSPVGWVETARAKLTASDGLADDLLGNSVAIDGDTIVVGAPYDDVGANTNQGSAYVFVRPSTGWASTAIYAARLTAADSAAHDWFGTSVAISGDTIAVGAYGDDIGANGNQGAVYVFVRPPTGWATSSSYAARLAASDGAVSDLLGYSVAIDGDTIVVGAYGDDVGPNPNQGSAYVFVRPPTGWATSTQTALLTSSELASDSSFGHSVAITDDTIVVGAPLAMIGSNPSQGSVHVYVRPPTGWASTPNHTARLTASDGAGTDYFGASVAVNGDTIVVGASGQDVLGSVDQGAAYVFVRPLAGWATTTDFDAKLTAADSAAYDSFGGSIAISGDHIAVGAPNSDPGGRSSQGLAYAFVRPSGGWVTTSAYAGRLTVSSGEANDLFGCSAAISGDTMVVGALSDEIGLNAAQGSAHVFVNNAAPNTPASPSPANGAVGVPLAPTLSWTGGDPNAGDAVTRKVYFGTVNPPTSALAICWATPLTQCAPGTMTAGVTYYWRVAATDSFGATSTGPVWSFTTVSATATPTNTATGTRTVTPTASATPTQAAGAGRIYLPIVTRR